MFLGIDLGTSEVKLLLLSEAQRVLAVAGEKLPPELVTKRIWKERLLAPYFCAVLTLRYWISFPGCRRVRSRRVSIEKSIPASVSKPAVAE